MRPVLAVPVLAFVLLVACAPAPSADAEAARQVVLDYYAAFDARDYRTMYALISEGFKELEPTAATYDDFEAYMSSFFDTASGIRVASAEVAYATATEVGVNYVAVITFKNGAEQELKSTFTVKKKQEGWRLIHPYGEHIDLS